MIDIIPILDLTKILAGFNPKVVHYGKSVHIPIYTSCASFVCCTRNSGIKLAPIAIRLTFNKTVSNIFKTEAELISATITCTTRNSVAKLAGAQVCVASQNFELYGRLRRSKCDTLYREITGSSYVSLALSSVLSHNSCAHCEFRPLGSTVKNSACATCNVEYFKVRQRKDLA